MAFQIAAKSNDNFLGLSGDVKPTKGVGVGTYFTEIDTGAKYVWFNGAWAKDLTLIYAIQQAMEQ